MAHPVICYYCNQRFDRDLEPFVQVNGNRYAHKDCIPDYARKEQTMAAEEQLSPQEKNYQDYEDLIKYIKQLFKMRTVLPTVIKQIKEYKQNYGYSYSGMRKTLYWFYELKGNSIKKANGTISIIPFVYDKALDYYYHLYLGKIAAEEETVPIPAPQKITIQSPVCIPELMKRRPFLLEDEE